MIRSRLCIARSAALLLATLVACSPAESETDSALAEGAAGDESVLEEPISLASWQEEYCGAVTIGFDERPKILTLGRNAAGDRCSPTEGGVGLSRVSAGTLDSVRTLVVYGEIDFDNVTSLFSSAPNVRTIQFLDSVVSGHPDLGESQIMSVLFDGSRGDFREFGPLPELVDLSIGPGDAPVYLPDNLGTFWPSLRSVTVGRAAVQNLSALNTVGAPIELIVWDGHPELGTLGEQLSRVVITEDAAADFTNELERLAAAGVMVVRVK